MENEAKEKNRKQLPPGVSRRKDGRYQGRFTYKGKRYTLYDKDLKKLVKKISDMKYELEHGIQGDASNVIFDKWFQVWLNEYKKNIVKESTYISYEANYLHYVKPYIGNMKLEEIGTIDIQKLYNRLLELNLSVGTVELVNANLCNIFRQAVKSGLITKNPCSGVVIPREKKKEPRVLTMYEQTLFLQAIQGDFYETLYLLALFTGLRIGEVTGLTWDDIDFKNSFMVINRTLLYLKDPITKRYVFKFQTPKSSTSQRIIPLLDVLLNLLKEHQKKQFVLKKKMGEKWKPLKGFENLIFTTRFGTPVQEVYIVKKMDLITGRMNNLEYENAKREGRRPALMEKITPHTLRHSFATRAFEYGMTPKSVQEFLGHSNLNITMNLYTHVTLEKKFKEMNKMSGLFDDEEIFMV